MDVRFLILFLFVLSSCMPEPQVARSNLSNSTTTGGSTSGGSSGIPSPTSTHWQFLGSLSGSITINVSNLNSAYLVGLPVENYLSQSENFTNANYCLVATFSLSGTPLELRSRIVPISYYDFSAMKTVRILRVDFQDVTNSTSICGQTLRVKNSAGNYVADSSYPGTHEYDPNQLCPTCTSMLTATRVRLFKKGNVFLDEVPTNLIHTSGLGLRVDPNYSTGGGGGSCSETECRARGFDCCLNNQCVRDGAIKPGAATQYPSLLQTAEAERLINPLAYLNYPQLYYICGTHVPPSTTTGGSGGDGGYDAAFELKKKDYYCIEHLKSQATTNPFHTELLHRSYTPATDCLTNSSDENQTMHFHNVMKRLYSNCECAYTDLSDAITNCPAYEYVVATRDSNNVPTSINCYTPPNTPPEIPTQQTVNVPSKSAPHRFFDGTGVERNISGGGTTYTQEGDKFRYLDNGNLFPDQKNFSINAILGQMEVTLDRALPAKSVDVELDQVYLLSTTSGHYTPCPTCARDSWFSAFSAFPTTSAGTGLQGVGHSTQRDAFSTNLTAGNYEDTIFGRACWLPPTMIPFSHSGKSSEVDQRRNRLATQAALFVNGYQRDWFGFNKGALIASFDGVTWFAVGKGRIVRATSKKLFLAINAPFADLANNSTHVVNVFAYDGTTQAAQVDYDPDYHQIHPYQNEAGNCQKFHMCSTDTDCITQLGWEYACADVGSLRTNWPSFDAEAKENPGSSSQPIDQILQQKSYVGSSTKRCVYRGAGALCLVNSGTIPATELNKKKLLTCAPNFYCANVNSAAHNSKISRYGSPLEDIPVTLNHLFGQDANILGRPLHYVSQNDVLPSSSTQNVRGTLIENMTVMDPVRGPSNTGLCQPGKILPTATNETTLSNPFTQQMAKDTGGRTDFINQIASCNSTLFTQYRHSSCPVIGSDGNYEIFSSGTLPTDLHLKATAQNACGLESLSNGINLNNSAEVLKDYSPFRNIEARTLASQTVSAPTLVRDACLRRAGAVCHTDLDCSPNSLHAGEVDYYGANFFGNEVEKNYYKEYLVCGQTDPKPFPHNTLSYDAFDMTKNRCCREVGSDLTSFTGDLPTSVAGGAYNPHTVGLKMSISPGMIPNDPKRYSRYATVDNIGSSERPILSAFQDRDGAGSLTANSQGVNVMTARQWKTLREANSETCCGGGWIRKFSDGTNDWTRTNRLYLDVENFKCINSRTPLITSPSDLDGEYSTSVQTLVDQDYGDYCKDATGTNGSCAQYSIPNTTPDTYPTLDPYTTTIVNTLNPSFNLANLDYFFVPRSADEDPAVIVDYSLAGGRRNITIKIPSFVPTSFTGAGVSLVNSGSVVDPVCVAGAVPAGPTGEVGAGCQYTYDPTTRILRVGAATGTYTNQRVGVAFTFNTAGLASGVTRMKPGTASYYLRRLGRLELSGIPQIVHEELYCSDNAERPVPGIFRADITTRTQFQSNAFSFEHSGRRYTNHLGLALDPVFSSNDFKCCAPVGSSVTDQSTCCSGYGVLQGTSGTNVRCALPSGTNLMVYLNRFVSNEGPDLVETDFDQQTGEPLLSSSVSTKIREFGTTHCASGKTRQGGAFGSFEPEPQGPDTDLTSRIFNIVDSSRDNGQTSNAGTTINTGYAAFMDGFRWNHHLYCDD